MNGMLLFADVWVLVFDLIFIILIVLLLSLCDYMPVQSLLLSHSAVSVL